MAVNPHHRQLGDSILSVPGLQGYPTNPTSRNLNPLLPPAQFLATFIAPQGTPSLSAQQTAFPSAAAGSTVMNAKPLTSTPSITVNKSQVLAPPPLIVPSNIASAKSLSVSNPALVSTGPPGFGGWG